MTVRVVRRHLEGWVDPAVLFQLLAESIDDTVWLDAGHRASSGCSYLTVELDPAREGTVGESPSPEPLRDTPDDYPAGRFAPGQVGWISYEGTTRWASVSSMIEFDHESHEVTHVYADDAADPRRTQARVETVDALLSATSVTAEPHGGDTPRRITWRHDDAVYAELIIEAQRRIHDGDAYQLCLTNMATVTPGLSRAESVAVYLRLRARNPSHHGGFVSLGDTTLLSCSPEVFLSVTPHGRVSTKPIKGTRPRGASPREDAALQAELADNLKEQAENVMIVDLMRNDLSRVAVTGSVNVDSLLAVESYANVHQLVSTVSAQLAPGMTAWDAVRACFPAGSMTGAPKVSAIALLRDLEGGPRGVYSGAFGFVGANGSVELAMTIRSMVVTEESVLIGSGGGITSDSDPEAEVAEMHLKVAPLLEALGVAANLGVDD